MTKSRLLIERGIGDHWQCRKQLGFCSMMEHVSGRLDEARSEAQYKSRDSETPSNGQPPASELSHLFRVIR